MTYSIIGRDPAAAEIGAAVQSKFPGIGSIALHGEAGVGCITTQAFANPRHGPDGLALLRLGATPAQALDVLVAGDAVRDERQVALMAPAGPAAVHTGAALAGWDGTSGSRAGPDCLASGNALAGPAVLDAMVGAFADAAGDLADRLVAALRAGRDAGGERRGQQSAAVLVVKPGGGYGGVSGRHVDVQVYDHGEPIEELARCLRLHRLSYHPSRPNDLVPIGPDLARELKAILRRTGFADLADGPGWPPAATAALRRFMGSENYDNRLRDDAQIDVEVLADIRRRHGGG